MLPSLLKQYEVEWEKHLHNIPLCSESPTNPLLLDVPSAYLQAECRVMIFGQETNDWEKRFPHNDGVRHILNSYKNFYLENLCYSYGGQFFNGVSQLKRALTDRLSRSYNSIEFLWNNVVKIGRMEKKGTPSETVLEWEDNWFDVVRFEVQVLKPDIVIFFSGPNYDKFLRRIFNDISFTNVNQRDQRQLAYIKSENLPKNTIRTYHPNYLWRRGFYNYLSEIVDAIDNRKLLSKGL